MKYTLPVNTKFPVQWRRRIVCMAECSGLGRKLPLLMYHKSQPQWHFTTLEHTKPEKKSQDSSWFY